MIEHFLIGYNTYKQITDIILDLENFNGTPAIKTRLYRIPTYISITEGCLTNLFRFILLLLDQTTEKDYASQNKLGAICSALKSNGFESLILDINVNIRNAINHGGIIFKENDEVLDFLYTENRKSAVHSIDIYSMDLLIQKIFDLASSVLLGITHFLNDHLHLITIDRTDNTFLSFSLQALELSLPKIQCESIYDLPDYKQLNLNFYIHPPTNKASIREKSIEIALIIYSKFPSYDQYMITFENERLQTSWIRFSNKDIFNIINFIKKPKEVISEVMERYGGCMIFDPSTEKIDIQEVKYFRFPNYTSSTFKINQIRNASMPEQKRLNANLYIGDENDKKNILLFIEQAIDWLKNIKTPPSPTLPQKYGSMEADSLYINVYRNDTRKSKELSPNNNNFVCFVDYNITGKTTLKSGGLFESLWCQFYHETIGNTQIAWRENRYYQKKSCNNIGRNVLCPCGSNKKYKQCCLTR